MISRLLLVITSVVAMLWCGAAVEAQLIVGSTGSSQNGGTPNTLFTLNTSTGVATQIGTTSATPNSLGFDSRTGLYYYGDHNTDDFYVFDPVLGVDLKIGDATAFGAPANSRFSGPGDVYQGRYYYVAEGPGAAPNPNENTIRWFEFSANGKSIIASGNITVTLPSGVSGFGDLGDWAINPTTGVMYAAMADNPGLTNELVGVLSIDILSAAPSATVLNPNEGLDGRGIQLAFTRNGDLFANRFDNRPELLPVDLVTGVLGAPVALVGTTADFFDLASVGEVPEPAGLAMIWAFSLALGRRRRS